MRVAALYDIHANLPALESVLQEVGDAQVDHVVIGGDVLPGPMPRETLDRLLALDIETTFIRGNGDRVVLETVQGKDPGEVPDNFRDIIRWNAGQLDSRHRDAIAGWPATARVDITGVGEVLFCHATPRNDTEIFTKLTPDRVLAPIFDATGAAVVVCGHTHMQFDCTAGHTRVVNAGSVGMPFGRAGAYWLLLGPDVRLRRTPYHLSHAADRIRASSYPQAEQFAVHNILQPPSEEQMIEIFTKAQLQS
jgi:putative phosphoesterase